MYEVNLPYSANTSTSPPNCAICLGPCTNKCFSDSCMHQFCFTCLLEWSKIKAVCPLCKQPFTSIIHNVKSNNEYDEHFIEAGDTEQVRDVLEQQNDFLYLPSAPPSRHFQFRTTFTVDPRGELAIQQMLLTHPLTNSVYMPDYNYPTHRRRDTSSVAFRRNIYAQNLWVRAQPDITGIYRDVSPNFYRENPAARNHLVPWLNRELSALLDGNTQQVMHLVDVILGHLYHHHIRSRFFKNLLREYLGNRTEHFIHEFYSFMRSPFDMIGYDRHIFYSPRSSYIQTISEEDDSNSDVTVIGVSEANTDIFRRPTIEVIEINSDSSRDSDVILQEPAPTIVIDLVNSDTDIDAVTLAINSATEQSARSDNDNERTTTTSGSKRGGHSKKKLKERCAKSWKKSSSSSSRQKSSSSSSKYQYSSSSSSSYSSEESDSSESFDDVKYKYLKRKRKQRLKRSSRSKASRKYSSSSSESSDDSEPLIETVRRAKESSRHKRREKKRPIRDTDSDTPTTPKMSRSGDYSSAKVKRATTPNVNVPLSSHSANNEPAMRDVVKSENSKSYAHSNNLNKVDDYYAGPSNNNNNNNNNNNSKLVSKIKKEKSMWYSRPYAYDSDSSVD